MATVIALGAAIYGLWQNTTARNLQTIADMAQKLSDLRQRAFETGVYGDEYREEPWKTHAFQMLDFVEHACFLVNKGHVSGKSAEFMLDWLRGEVPHMMAQSIFKDLVDKAQGGHLSELKKMIFRLENEAVDRRVTGQ